MQKEIEFLESKINRDTVLIAASFMVAVIGLLMPMDNDVTLRIGVFLLVAGSLFAGVKIYILIEHEYIKQKFYTTSLDAFKVQNGLQLPVQAETLIDLRTQSVITHRLQLTQAEGEKETTQEILWQHGEEPKREFILACWRVAEQNQWRVTERAMAALFPDYDSNAKLSLMERVGIFQKADERSNAVRIWQIKTFPNPNIALEAFGYAPIEPGKPHPPTEPLSP